MRVVVVNHLTLDGVMQGPGRPDEDTRDGFAQGGWGAAAEDPAVIEAIGRYMGQPGGGLLLGRRSYEDMLGAWNERGGPFKEALNAADKFVASRDSATTLKWPNSMLLHGDVAAAIADLKQRPGGDLVIMGSGELIRSLLPEGLIDEFLLLIHPLLLGEGRRLFEGIERAQLRLVDSNGTESGVLVATYRPGGPRPSD